jgi:glyoxylase-like metal-dependent hydrolase (beta-lactamase superfamily II)
MKPSKVSSFLVFALALFAHLSAFADGGAKVRLYVLDCGDIEVMDLRVFQPDLQKPEVKNLAVTCYLVVHPRQGALMFDTGIGDEYVGKPKTLIMGFANFSARKTLASQLQEIGYPPSSVRYLAMSHLHLDHTGNAKLFPQAVHLIQDEEYVAGFESPDAAKLVADTKLIEPLRMNPTRRLAGDLDVFGDGSVWIKRTVGHTPGHQSLLVHLASGLNVFISGDIAHYTENWVNRTVPGFNYDAAASVRTMLDVQRLLVRENAVLWIGHDLEQSVSIRHAPQFYE